jgi:hypothetical protein
MKIQDKVLWFPHKVKCSDSLSLIEDEYPSDGYRCWFKLLEKLGDSDGHFIDINNEDSFKMLLKKVKVGDTTLLKKILSRYASLDMIDKELFSKGIIWSDNFLAGVNEVYRSRHRPPPLKPEIKGLTLTFPQRPESLPEDYTEPLSKLPARTEVLDKKRTEQTRGMERGTPAPVKQSTSSPQVINNVKSEQPSAGHSKISFKAGLILNEQKIEPTFLLNLLGKCSNDIHQLGRVLFRARNSKSPVGYIFMGLEKQYIWNISKEESDSKRVNDWIDTNVLKYVEYR